MRPTLAPVAAALLLTPALLAAQQRPTTTAARPPATRDTARTGAGVGFEPGHLFVGPRTWLGINGTASIGGQAEIAVSKPGQYGPGVLAVGASADVYHYSESYAFVDWSMTVVPIGGYVNYHVPLSDKRIDPYVGAGLGFAMVSASVRSSLDDYSASSGRASGVFSFGQVGARYFFKPNLAVQAQTGWGFGGMSLGVTWKR